MSITTSSDEKNSQTDLRLEAIFVMYPQIEIALKQYAIRHVAYRKEVNVSNSGECHEYWRRVCAVLDSLSEDGVKFSRHYHDIWTYWALRNDIPS